MFIPTRGFKCKNNINKVKMMKIIGYQYKAWKHITLILHWLTEFGKMRVQQKQNPKSSEKYRCKIFTVTYNSLQRLCGRRIMKRIRKVFSWGKANLAKESAFVTDWPGCNYGTKKNLASVFFFLLKVRRLKRTSLTLKESHVEEELFIKIVRC